jgi:hypothetical protein
VKKNIPERRELQEGGLVYEYKLSLKIALTPA